MYVVIAGLHGYGSTMINDFKGRLPLGTAQILRAYVESLAADLRPRSQTRIRQDRELSGRFEKHTAFNYAKNSAYYTRNSTMCRLWSWKMVVYNKYNCNKHPTWFRQEKRSWIKSIGLHSRTFRGCWLSTGAPRRCRAGRPRKRASCALQQTQVNVYSYFNPFKTKCYQQKWGANVI